MADHGVAKRVEWFDQKHADYDRERERIDYAMTHYEGNVLDSDKIKGFLFQHSQAESEEAFEERKKIAQYKPHFAFAVDSLAGQLFAKESDISRTFSGEDDDSRLTLGDPDDTDTIIGRLWKNVDGTGSNYPTVWKTLAPRLIANRKWGIFVDAPTGEKSSSRITLLDPRNVWDKIYDNGRLIEIKVYEESIVQASMQETPETVKEVVIYTLEGWTRYTEDGSEVDSGAYVYWDDKEKKEKHLPYREIEVPIRRDLGYSLAKTANATFNLESTRDFRVWSSCINRLALNTDQSPTEIKKGIKEGTGIIITTGDRGRAEYINPSQEPALASTKILEQQVREFYEVFFRGYANAGRQATATEIMQDVAAGVQAYLVLLKTAIDEAENFVLGMLEQIHFPENADAWGTANVKRTDQFAPINPSLVAAGLLERYIEPKLPIGIDATINVIKRALDLDGIGFDDEQLKNEVAEWKNEPDPEGGIISRREARVLRGTSEQTAQLVGRLNLARIAA